MSFTIHRHPDTEAFLRVAGPWLLRDEAEHNLMLGLAERGRGGGLPPDSFFATIEEADGIVGCAMRTPPLKLLVTRMPPGAEEPLAEVLDDAYGALPAVLGPEVEAMAFARAWARRRGVRHQPGMRQRIYRLDTVVPPERTPPGRLRRAEARDRELAVAWMEAFHDDTRTERTDPQGSVRRWSDARDLFLWDDGEPRCMTAIAPDAERRRGGGGLHAARPARPRVRYRLRRGSEPGRAGRRRPVLLPVY
jgi:hypothetical protein